MTPMRIAICPGSFDPITKGHVSMIERAAKLFDCVYVVTMVNAEKKGFFSEKDRLFLMEKALAHIPNVKVDSCQGLLAAYAKEQGATHLVKGVRNGTDLDDEMLMMEINRQLEGLDTVLLPAYKEDMYISSTVVREMLRYERPAEAYIPASIEKEIRRLWDEKRKDK